jgi:formamidopyrimidine-DNA glycosylase
MPELPEIASRVREMQAALVGKTICRVEVLQPRVLNLPPEEFAANIAGASLQQVTRRGKWIQAAIDRGYLLINMGMGGELLLCDREHLPGKRRLVLDFTDATSLVVNFWWFGHVHFVPPCQLASHRLSSNIGTDALEMTATDIGAMAAKHRGPVKSLLLDQTRIAGIGNAYIHDILFLAHLHPLRPSNTLSGPEVQALADGIRRGLVPSMELGGAFYETDLYGRPGGFTMEHILVGYREGQPCTECGESIIKIKTGSNSSFICPRCQPMVSTDLAESITAPDDRLAQPSA